MNYIYIIDDYAGVTEHIGRRKAVHKFGGRDVSRIQVIKAFEDRSEAEAYEKHLHNSCGYKGSNYSKEISEKISDSNKGRIPWNKGIPHSEETKAKIAKKATGRKASPETRAKLSAMRLGKLRGPNKKKL